MKAAWAIIVSLGVLAMVFSATVVTAQRITKLELDQLFERREVETARVDVDSEGDRLRIMDTGVVVWTREPTYLIVAGDKSRMDAMRALGFPFRQPRDADFVRRFVAVRVSNAEEHARITFLLDGTLPASRIPGRVYAHTFDKNIEWAREAGFDVEMCRGPMNCE